MNDFTVAYCERTQWGLWAEPMNLISNLAFIIIFIYLLYQIRTFKKVSKIYYFFASLVLGIGVGSILFHSLATPFAKWLDILPIFTFIFFYILWANQKILNLKLPLNLFILGLFIATTVFLNQVASHILTGSLAYIPAWIYLAAFSSIKTQNLFLKRRLQTATMLFTLALIARVTDNIICPIIPIGTHFIWHILNACLLYYLCTIADLVETYPNPKSLVAKGS